MRDEKDKKREEDFLSNEKTEEYAYYPWEGGGELIPISPRPLLKKPP